MRRSVPYTEKKQVCSRTQLWHVSTPVVYPWSPVIMPFVVRGANLDYCADLGIDELTEEDLEICEVVCQPSKVQECAKVSIYRWLLTAYKLSKKFDLCLGSNKF